MPLSPDRLFERLRNSPLDSAYFFYGEEPLQIMEMADALRTRARADGLIERRVFDADNAGDWDQIDGESNALSLFAERRLIEIRIGSRNPDKRGTDVLERIASTRAGDDIFLILAGSIESRVRKSRWFKVLEKDTICVVAREPEPAQMPEWLVRRAARHGKKMTREAAQLIAERVEGNLLAAAQEVAKLCLLVEGGTIADEDVIHAVTDSARFDVYQLVDAVITAQSSRALRILRGLREEGTEVPLITWALGRELRQLAAMRGAVARGTPVARVLDEYRVWNQRKAPLRRMLESRTEDEFLGLLTYANFVDTVAKGGRDGSAWDEIAILVLGICGQPAAHKLMATI